MTTLRPNRSPNFPYKGTTIVDVSKYDVTTHDRLSSPPSSPTMVGSAVDTMVWSSAPSSMTSSSAVKSRRIGGLSEACAAAAVWCKDAIAGTRLKLINTEVNIGQVSDKVNASMAKVVIETDSAIS